MSCVYSVYTNLPSDLPEMVSLEIVSHLPASSTVQPRCSNSCLPQSQVEYPAHGERRSSVQIRTNRITVIHKKNPEEMHDNTASTNAVRARTHTLLQH